MIATQRGLGVDRSSSSYQYTVIASQAAAYFKGGIRPVSVWLSEDYTRAAPGGTGEAKCGGNYAAAFAGQIQAVQSGCDQVVWLDAVERRWVEEMGGMNLFFVYGTGPDARIMTPALTGTMLPALPATRSSPSARISASVPKKARSPPTSGGRNAPPGSSPKCSPAEPPP